MSLLLANDVTAVADVRSVPASQFTPQFNREALKRKLRENGIKYVFLGDELGARSRDPSCYVDGRVQYDRLAGTDLFRNGIKRLRVGAATESIAIMCAEQEPLDCHRTILVSRVLQNEGIHVTHIHADGRLETHNEAMERLMKSFGLGEADLFHDKQELVIQALKRQEEKIAFTAKTWTLT
ncbi:uncharacterized protein (DUF488 family) [Conyzicola lurida]|uniref:Uncharacterized protein (DUF488 family) n=1 Tax=Conyzicola lurida TaxID=1172621 RepID=A0A841AKY1_9MICO|nr:uncharacterized protein (DUF488 family) [Conyzicola lurida]